ncbi:extracellular solute-binding protein [Mollicutes bacterium LVI A0078]|nr:extracellular solute-binding protein [Mollicutes bacterium LVI A0075]WOO90356.1 extracellular solute-binding protein [Mollicutes bacterium LVI A0078]
MKKLLTSLFALILVLAGCSTTDGSTDTTDAGSADVELSGSIQVAVDGGYTDYMNAMGEAFTAETGVTVEVVEADMFDILDALPTQQGNTADIFMLPNDRVGDLANQKLITPVTTDLSGYTDTAVAASTFADEQYFLPMATDTTLFIYNKELLDEVPASLSELEVSDWAAKFTDFYHAGGAFMSEGGYIFGSDNADTSDLGLNNDGSVAAAEFIQSLYTSGDSTWDLMKDDTVAYDIMEQAFKDGDVKAIINGPWALAGYEEAGVDYAIAPIPSLTGNGTYSPLVGTKGLGINAYSSNVDAAQAFLAFLGTAENAQAFYDETLEVNPHTEIAYEEGSNEAIILEATSNGTSMPTDPAFGKVWEPMADALKQIAAGEDAASALDAAVETIANDIAAM